MTSSAPVDGFRAWSFDPAGKTVRPFRRDGLAAELASRSTFAWIDLQTPGVAALRALLAEMGLDDAPCRGFDTTEILPRIEEQERYVSFHLFEIEDPERHLDTSKGLAPLTVARLVVVLGADFIVTFHTQPIAAVDDVRRTCPADFRLAGKTPGFVAFLLLQRCLYDFADLNLASDNYLDALDAQAAGDARDELERQVAVAGRNILTLKKLTTSLHIVLMLLATKRSLFVSDEGRASFREMQDNAASVRSAVDSSRDMLDGVVAAMQAESAQRTSEIATVLTIVSAIMLPLTLIAGLYGMNFTVIPGAEHPQGFWWLVVGMGLLTVAMIAGFKRLGWFGGR
jgi:magnesium transporter